MRCLVSFFNRLTANNVSVSVYIESDIYIYLGFIKNIGTVNAVNKAD